MTSKIRYRYRRYRSTKEQNQQGGTTVPAVPVPRLLSWYHKHRRKLPWRETRDPYKIWVSEIMLQQTQVETVLPYYERWLKAFPSVQSLARAPISKVLKLWEGLGYYSRAKNLHRSAQIILKTYGGKVPGDEPSLLALPGIGRYTAGAILSIAYNQNYPVVDGNVARVLARIFCFEGDPRSTRHQTRLWQIASDLVPEGKAGDFNQALMELGAVLCKPENPSCLLCPVERYCKAHQLGKEEEIPEARSRAKIEKREAACALLRKNGKVLIVQYPQGELWAGLWGLPEGRKEREFDAKESLRRRLAELGVSATLTQKIATAQRSYTRYRERLHVFEAELSESAHKGGLSPSRGTGKPSVRWISPNDFPHYPFSSVYAKILKTENNVLPSPPAGEG